MTIFDRKIVFTNIQDKDVPRHNNADIIIKNEAYANRMIDLFELYWSNAFTIGEMKDLEMRTEIVTKKSEANLRAMI